MARIQKHLRDFIQSVLTVTVLLGMGNKMEYFDEEVFSSFEDKWHSKVVEKGFTMVPNALLEYYTRLELTPSELLLLINIASYHWYEHRLPFVTVETLAKRMGMEPRHVTRIISSLEVKKEAIRRIRRKGTSNLYSLGPLDMRLVEAIYSDKNVTTKGQNSQYYGDISDTHTPTQMSSKEYEANEDETKDTLGMGFVTFLDDDEIDDSCIY